MTDNLQNSGVPSGFPSLDKITGGWQPSDLIVVAARPYVGKTSFVLTVARNAAVDYRIPVAFFSLETTAVQLAKRMMVSETGLSIDKIKGGQKLERNEWKLIEEKTKYLSGAPLYIDDTPSLPVLEFRSKVKRLVEQKGVRLVIVNYLQLMQGPAELRKMREQEITFILKTLKATAEEMDVPVIALSQLSRPAVKRQGRNSRPQLSDLREAPEAIGQYADMVLLIHRYDNIGYYDAFGLNAVPSAEAGRTDLIIAKHKNGECADVPLKFLPSELRFVMPPCRTPDLMHKDFDKQGYKMIIEEMLPDIADGLTSRQRTLLNTVKLLTDADMLNAPGIVWTAYVVGCAINRRIDVDVPYAEIVDYATKHPLGDVCYDEIIRLAAEWRLPYPMLGYHGNFGSLQGDCPAYMLYTSINLSDFAKDVVEPYDNLDNKKIACQEFSRVFL